jgi:hypothetical protein
MIKPAKFLIILTTAIVLTSCYSTTLIESNPSGAKVYIYGACVGQTPYTYSDSKIVGSSFILRLEKDGYKNTIANITRDEEIDVAALIGGVFFTIPYLWTMKYHPMHHYEMSPLEPTNMEQALPEDGHTKENSKLNKILELKQLLDEKVITQDDFNQAKAKILEN